MWTLLISGTMLDDTGSVLSTLMFAGKIPPVIASCLFLVYILLSSITVMNMLIGVLCEVVVRMAQADRDDTAIRVVKETILAHLRQYDIGDGLISQAELKQVMEDPTSKQVLHKLNIDRLFLVELQTIFFPNPETKIAIRDVMELMLMCRG